MTFLLPSSLSLQYVLSMQACTTELYITSICHQIIIHKCYLNDRVLMNINTALDLSDSHVLNYEIMLLRALHTS